MGIYVTETGFQKPTLAELVTYYEESYQGLFGADIDLDPLGPFGQLVAFHAKRDADLFDGMEEIYTARNPSQATGTSLDYICTETGVSRLGATATLVNDTLCYGDEGTTILTGKQVRAEFSDTLFSATSNIVISATACNDIQLSPDDITSGTVISFLLDGETITYTVESGDTLELVLLELAQAVQASSFPGEVTIPDGNEFLRLFYLTTTFAVTSLSQISVETVATAGSFLADEAEELAIPANTLNLIATPVTGWDSVNNPLAGTTGSAIETDEELRIRREANFLVGKSTEEAIRQNILQNVEGVTTCQVTSNRTSTTDSEGRPPKSFEAVIEGGLDSDIGNEIWLSMPAGIEPYGLDSVTVVDSTGRDQVIGFSRPTPKYIFVKVYRDKYDEETYPVDGDNQIKEAIVAWSETEYSMSTDVIYQRISIPIYEVPGISTIEIEVAATDAPEDTPTYDSANISILGRELATFATDRITVEDLT